MCSEQQMAASRRDLMGPGKRASRREGKGEESLKEREWVRWKGSISAMGRGGGGVVNYMELGGIPLGSTPPPQLRAVMDVWAGKVLLWLPLNSKRSCTTTTVDGFLPSAN